MAPFLDETALLQSKFDALTPGNKLVLRKNHVYHVSRPLFIRTSAFIDFNGSTIYIHPGDNSPAGIHVEPKIGERYEWTEKIEAGQRPKVPAGLAGRRVCAYGVDVFDPYRPHYAGFSDEGGLPSPPYDIRGERHWCAPLLSSTDGIVLKNLRFDYAPGLNVNYGLGLKHTRGAYIQNVSGRHQNAVQIMDSEDVFVDGLEGECVVTHTASGRALTMWGSRRVRVSNLDVEISDRRAGFLFESWNDDVSLGNVRVRLRAEKAADEYQAPICMSHGGSSNVRFTHSLIDCGPVVDGLYLYDFGGQPNQARPEFAGITRWRGNRVVWPERCEADALVKMN